VPSQYTKTSYAGSVITHKKAFMEEYKNLILDKFLNNLKEVRLQDTSTSYDATLASIKASVTDMQLSNAKLGLHNTEFYLSDEEPNLYLKLDNVGFNFSFNYDIGTQP
jgi:hypothetical protein